MGKAMGLALVSILSISIFTYLDASAVGNDQVSIIGHRMSVDTSGVVHISGLVKNESDSAVRLVHVTAKLFDEDGNKLPTFDTYALVRTIPPGYIAPFDIPISDKRVGNSVFSYELSLDWKTAQTKDDKLLFSDLKVFVWTHLDPYTKEIRNPHGGGIKTHNGLLMSSHTEVDAIVTNTSEVSTKTVKVIAVWYDERGQYYSYDMQTVARQLAPAESSRFVIMKHPTMGYYSLLAESEDYVSMHIENGKHMFRVHEANNDNRLLAGVDTMSISNIIVKDTGNNVISKIPIMNKPVMPHAKPTANKSTVTINNGNEKYELQIRTYATQLLDYSYEQKTRTLTLMTDLGHTDMVHMEIIIPNTFDEFLSAQSFRATLNGKSLSDKLFFVDPYSYEGKTAMHYIIPADDMKTFSQYTHEEPAGHMIFTLRPVLGSNTVSINAGEPIQLQSTITNNIDTKQNFVYIMQVKNSKGNTVMISWIDGTIYGKESVDTVLSWTPEEKGSYTMQIFLWESLAYPSNMSSNFVNTTFVVL